jgi:hypothetical protein
MLKPHLNCVIKASRRVWWCPIAEWNGTETLFTVIEVDKEGNFKGNPFLKSHSELKAKANVTGTFNRRLSESEHTFLFRMITN